MGGDLGRRLDRGRAVELQHRAFLADVAVVDLKINQVAMSVRVYDRPCLIPSHHLSRIELAVGQLDVDPSQTDFLAVDARKVGLAAELRPEPAVQRVIPDVEAPTGRACRRSR